MSQAITTILGLLFLYLLLQSTKKTGALAEQVKQANDGLKAQQGANAEIAKHTTAAETAANLEKGVF